MRRFLRWLLGLNECIECGVIAVRWGTAVDITPPHSDKEQYGYLCERCSNDGVAYNEFKRGQCFEMLHPDSQFQWQGKNVPRVAVTDDEPKSFG